MEKLSGTQSKKQTKTRRKTNKKREDFFFKGATQSANKNKITLIIKKTRMEEDLKQNL